MGEVRVEPYFHSTVRSEWYSVTVALRSSFRSGVDLVEGKRAFVALSNVTRAFPGSPQGSFSRPLKSSSRATRRRASRHLRAPSRSRVRRAAGAVHGPRPAAWRAKREDDRTPHQHGAAHRARWPRARRCRGGCRRRPAAAAQRRSHPRAYRRCGAPALGGSAVSRGGPPRVEIDQRIGARCDAARVSRPGMQHALSTSVQRGLRAQPGGRRPSGSRRGQQVTAQFGRDAPASAVATVRPPPRPRQAEAGRRSRDHVRPCTGVTTVSTSASVAGGLPRRIEFEVEAALVPQVDEPSASARWLGRTSRATLFAERHRWSAR